MAKGIGNGFPLAAVVTTPDIAKSLTKASHFNTFGGNPVACAVGITVLDVSWQINLSDITCNVYSYLHSDIFVDYRRRKASGKF